MPGLHKCSYFMCTNTSAQKSMFSFPWNDLFKLRQWIDNCGNTTIAHLPAIRLRSKYLCIDHFDRQYVRNETGSRKRLRRTAIPKPFQDPGRSTPTPSHPSSPASNGSPDLKVLTPKKVYVNRKRILEIQEDPTSDPEPLCTTPKRRKTKEDQDTPKCRNLKKLLVNSTKKLQGELKKNTCLKKKLKNKNIINISNHKFNSRTSKLITKMQLRKSKSRKQWSEEEKKFCMSLYYKSPAAYKFMVQSGIILAAQTTIQRWLQETNCLPGVNDEILENIKIKFADKPIKERGCAVCFDEMSIMTDLEYTNKYDMIEGFEDYGGGDRNEKEAKYALVFIARGIYVNWKIPIAYFLSSKTVDSDKLGSIVDSVINKLFECDLIPKVVVCDQASTNVKMIKNKGATADSLFFIINGRKIFSIFDTPHLIKNIRNNLINNDFQLDDNLISFQDIINVYNIDKNNKSKSLKKLTPVHINPNNFQKMKVKLATQVLSNSVASAIKTAADSGELKSSTAQHTADFIKLCNDLFDCLNSKNKFDSNPYRCAITKNQNTIVNQTMIKSKEIFTKLYKLTYNKKNEKKLTRPPCFDGIIQTINAVLQLSAEEFTPGTGVSFIITYRLNQDVIENLFGIYRIKGGCNKNPTSKLLRSMFRSNLLNNLMKFDQTNCESDQDAFVATHTNTQVSQPKPSTSSSATIQQSDTDVEDGAVSVPLDWWSSIEPSQGFESSNVTSTLGELNHSSNVVTLETCSVVYFAGWLGKSCTEKFDCSDCKTILIKHGVDLTDKKQLLLIHKTYSNIVTPTLKSPSDFLVQLVNQVLDIYNKNTTQLYRINLVENLLKIIKHNITLPSDYHDWNHFDYLIKKLLQVKIHDYCKSRKKSLKSVSKLRILQNK